MIDYRFVGKDHLQNPSHQSHLRRSSVRNSLECDLPIEAVSRSTLQDAVSRRGRSGGSYFSHLRNVLQVPSDLSTAADGDHLRRVQLSGEVQEPRLCECSSLAGPNGNVHSEYPGEEQPDGHPHGLPV